MQSRRERIVGAPWGFAVTILTLAFSGCLAGHQEMSDCPPENGYACVAPLLEGYQMHVQNVSIQIDPGVGSSLHLTLNALGQDVQLRQTSIRVGVREGPQHSVNDSQSRIIGAGTDLLVKSPFGEVQGGQQRASVILSFHYSSAEGDRALLYVNPCLERAGNTMAYNDSLALDSECGYRQFYLPARPPMGAFIAFKGEGSGSRFPLDVDEGFWNHVCRRCYENRSAPTLNWTLS
jgi:hypothetical protein